MPAFDTFEVPLLSRLDWDNGTFVGDLSRMTIPSLGNLDGLSALQSLSIGGHVPHCLRGSDVRQFKLNELVLPNLHTLRVRDMTIFGVQNFAVCNLVVPSLRRVILEKAEKSNVPLVLSCL